MKTQRIETFDDWRDILKTWQKEINYDTQLLTSVLQGYEFTEKFAEPKHAEIEFGEFSGSRKWSDPSEISRAGS
jgi:hypothetical protein